MSTYFSVSDGNFSDAGVFAGTIPAADSADAIAAISISQTTLATAPFSAVAGDSIYGIALHLSARSITSTGNLTIDLQSANGIHVTENYAISSFTPYDGSNNLTTIYPQNWQLLKLTSPINIAAADSFTVSISASRSNEISFMGSAAGINAVTYTTVKQFIPPGSYTTSTPFTQGTPEPSFNLSYGEWLYHPYSVNFGLNSSTDFTIEGYFYFKSLPPTCHGLLNFGRGWNGGGFESAWGIHYRTDNQNIYFYRYSNGVQEYFQCIAPLTTSKWTHIAITRENGTLGIWVDGALAGLQTNNTVNYSVNAAPNDLLQIGYSVACGAYITEDMYVSNVRITKSALYSTIATTTTFAPLPSINDTAFLYNNTSTHKYTTSDSSNNIIQKEFNLTANMTNAVDTNKLYWTGTADKTLSTKNPFDQEEEYSYYFDGSTFINSRSGIGRSDTVSEFRVVDIATSTIVDHHTAVLGIANGRLCAEFDGSTTSRYITVPGRDMAIGIDDFTIECFIYPRAHTAAYPCIFRTRPNDVSNNNIVLFAGHSAFSTSKYQLALAGSTPYISSTSNIIYNAWTHIAAVRKSGVLYLYVNGVQEASMPHTIVLTSTLDWNIGTDSSQGNFMFNGYISDFRVTVAALYSAATEAVPSYPLTVRPGTIFLAHTENTSIVKDYSLTVDTWIQIPTTTAVANRTIAISTRTNSTDGWQMYVKPNGTVAVKIFTDGAVISGATILNPNRWYRVALVGQQGSYKLYIDGIQEGSTYTGTIDLRARNITLGARSSSEYFIGYIYDFRALDQVVVPSVSVPTAPLTISDCSPSTDYYISNITNSNTLKVSTKSPFNNNSVMFNGSSDYIDTKTSITLGTNDFTFEAWVKCFSIFNVNGRMILEGRPDSSNGPYFNLGITESGALGVTSNGSIIILTPSAVPANTWFHVAYTRASNVGRIFINGQLSVTGPDATNYASSTFKIGRNAFVGPNWLGHMTDVRIVNGTALYTTVNFSKPTTPLSPVPNTAYLLQAPIYSTSPATSIDSPFNGTTIVDSNSLYFNSGDATSITPPTPNTFDLSTSSNNIVTYECWLNTFDLPAGGNSCRVIMTGPNSNASSLVWLAIGADGGVYAAIPLGGVGYVGSPNTIRTNTWHHIAFTYNGSNASVFVDGKLKSRVSNFTRPNPSNYNLGIGYLDGTPTVNHQFKGYISDFRVVAGVELYTVDFPVPAAPLTAISGTSFLLNTLIVSGGSGILSIPGPTITGDNESMMFNGSTNYYESVQSLPSIDGDITIEFWFNRSTDTTSREFLLDTRSGTGPCFIDINIYGDKHLNFFEHNGNYGQSISKVPVTPRTWHHVVVQRKKDVIYTYYDGVLTNCIASSYDRWFGDVITIGRYKGANYYFNGYISNLRISSIARYNTPTITLPGKLSYDDGTLFLATAPYNREYNFSSTLLKASSPIEGKMVLPLTIDTPFESSSTPDCMFFEGAGTTGISLPASNNYKLGVGRAPFTIEFWIYLLTNTTARLLTVGNNTGDDAWGNMAFVLFIQSDYFYWQAHTSAGYGHGILHDTIRPSSRMNKWTHVVVQYDGRYTKMFINGVVSGYVIDLGSGEYQSASYDGKLCIGRSLAGTSYHTHALISNYRIVNGTAIYPDSGFIPPTSKLANVSGTVLLAQEPYTSPYISRALIPPAPPANTTANDMLFFNGTTFLQTIDPLMSVPGDASIEFWVYCLRTGANDYFLDARAGAVASSWLIGKTDSNTLRTYFPTDTRAGTLLDKTWNYISVTRENNTVTMSINGSIVAVTSNIAADLGGNKLLIGKIWDGYNLVGYLSNIRITKSVPNLSVAGFTPSMSPLTVLPATTFLLKPGLALDKYIVNTDTKALSARDPISLDCTTYTPLVSASNRSLTEPDYFKFGIGTWIEYKHHSDFDLYNVDYTYEAWAYISNAGVPGENGGDGNFRLLSKMNCACWGGNFQFWINTNNKVGIWYGDRCAAITSTAEVPIREWFHVAFVSSVVDNKIKIYVNGVYKDSINQLLYSNNTQSLWIGSDQCGNVNFGYISNARLIKGKQEYNGDFTPATSLTATPETVLLVKAPYNTFDGNAYTSFDVDLDVTTNPNTGSPAYTFNGTSHQIKINPKEEFNLSNKQWTMEAWIKPTGSGEVRTIFSKRHPNTTIAYLLYLTSDGHVRFHNYWTDQYSEVVIANDVWTHIAIMNNTNNTFLFVNGQIKWTFSGGLPNHAYAWSYPFLIGYSNWGSQYFQGSISDVRVVYDYQAYDTIAYPIPTAPISLTTSGTTVYLLTDSVALYDTSSGVPGIYRDNSTEMILASDPGANTPYTDMSGNFLGRSVYFNGTSAFMRTATLPMLGRSADDGEFTVEFWFKSTRVNPVQECLFDNRQVGSWNLVIDLNVYSSYSVKARLNDTNIDSGPNTYTANVWTHVVVARKDNLVILYVNGKITNTVRIVATTAQIAAADMWIGQYYNSQGYFFKGYMSDIRIVSDKHVYSGYASFALPNTAPSVIPGKTALLLGSTIYRGTEHLTYSSKKYFTYPNRSNILVPGSPFAGVDNSLSLVRDHIAVPHNDNINLYGVEWTFETWVYPYPPNGSWRCIMYKHTGNGGARSYSLYMHPSYNFIHFGNEWTYDTYEGVDLYPWKWYHIALVSDSITTKLYINGVFKYTFNLSATYETNGQYLGIGRENSGSGAASFEGYLSNMRLIKGKQMYTNDFTPSTTPLDITQYTSLLLKNPYTPLIYTAYAIPTNIHITSSLLSNTIIPNTITLTQDQRVNNLWVHNKSTLNVPINNNITLEVLGVSGMHVTSDGTLNIT